MNKDYIKAKAVAEKALSELKSIFKHIDGDGFEDNKAYVALENIIENTEVFTSKIKHYSKDTQEGYLYINSNDRYELKGKELTCGYSIEVYNEEWQEWNAGRIEHSSSYGGYYFYNYDEDSFALSDGMKARIRI